MELADLGVTPGNGQAIGGERGRGGRKLIEGAGEEQITPLGNWGSVQLGNIKELVEHIRIMVPPLSSPLQNFFPLPLHLYTSPYPFG